MTERDVLLPLVYWDGVPTHNATCVTFGVSRLHGGYVFTGARDGAIVLWRLRKSPAGDSTNALTLSSTDPLSVFGSSSALAMTAVLLRSQSSAACMAFARCVIDSQDAVLAGYADGCLAAWPTSGDGAIFCRPILSFAPTCLKVFYQSQFVACAGNGLDDGASRAVVVHLASQRVLQLMPHSSPVVSLFIVKIKADYFIYTLTDSGTLSSFVFAPSAALASPVPLTASPSTTRYLPSLIDAHLCSDGTASSLDLEPLWAAGNPWVSLSFAPSGGVLLAVSGAFFAVLGVATLQLLHLQAAPHEDDQWAGATFVASADESVQVLAWTARGAVLLFEVDSRPPVAAALITPSTPTVSSSGASESITIPVGAVTAARLVSSLQTGTSSVCVDVFGRHVMCAAAGNVKYFLLPVSPTNQIASLKEASLAHSFTSAPLDIVASMWLRCSSTLVRLLRVTRTGRVFTVDLCESSRSECELLQLHDVSITCARLCDSLLLLGDSLGRVFVCELLSTQAGRVFCLDIAANKSAILSIQQHHPQLPDHFNSVEEPIDETEPALHRVNSLDIKAMQAALQATNVDRTAGKALPPASDLQKAAINRLNSDPNLERIGGVSSPLVEPDYVAQSMLGPMQQAVRQTNEEEISRLARDAASRVFVCDADGAVSVIDLRTLVISHRLTGLDSAAVAVLCPPQCCAAGTVLVVTHSSASVWHLSSGRVLQHCATAAESTRLLRSYKLRVALNGTTDLLPTVPVSWHAELRLSLQRRFALPSVAVAPSPEFDCSLPERRTVYKLHKSAPTAHSVFAARHALAMMNAENVDSIETVDPSHNVVLTGQPVLLDQCVQPVLGDSESCATNQQFESFRCHSAAFGVDDNGGSPALLHLLSAQPSLRANLALIDVGTLVSDFRLTHNRVGTMPTDLSTFSEQVPFTEPATYAEPSIRARSGVTVDPSGVAHSFTVSPVSPLNSTAAQVAPLHCRGLMSLLFDWSTQEQNAPEASNTINKLLRQQLSMPPPNSSAAPSFGIWHWSPNHVSPYLGRPTKKVDNSAALSPEVLNEPSVVLLAPAACKSMGRLSFSPETTATQLLSTAAMCMSAMTNGPQVLQGHFSRLIAHYSVVLPTSFPAESPFVESSLDALAAAGVHPNDDINLPARLLLQGVVERMSASQRRACVEEWSSKYLGIQSDGAAAPSNALHPMRATLVNSVGKPRVISALASNRPTQGEMRALLLLSVLAFYLSPAERDAYFGVDQWSALTEVLLTTLYAFSPAGTPLSSIDRREVVCVSLAADLLSRGTRMWIQHVSDPTLLLRTLFSLTHHAAASVSSASSRALLECARCQPHFFVACVSAHAQHVKSSEAQRAAALQHLCSVARKYPAALIRELPAAIETIARCLDPANAGVRQALLTGSTQALFTLVQRFPMTAFHQPSQRFVVGTCTGHAQVIVYDLRTASKFRVLECGDACDGISAVAISDDGEHIAAYAADERPAPTVRVWRLNAGGFFAGLLGSSNSAALSFTLAPLSAQKALNVAAASSPLASGERDLKAPKDAATLHAELVLQNIRMRWQGERVLLTREDRSECVFDA